MSAFFNSNDLSRTIIKDLDKKMKFLEMKVDSLLSELRSNRKEKALLDTQVRLLKGEVVMLKDVIARKEAEQTFFDVFSIELNENEQKSSSRYEDELDKKTTDNGALHESLNNLRKENAMLKEQHLSDKHQAQLNYNELNKVREQVFNLQYLLEHSKNHQIDLKELSYQDLPGVDIKGPLDRGHIHRNDLQ